MEILFESKITKLLSAYEYVTGEKYLSSAENRKEYILVYISYLLEKMGFDFGKFKYILDPENGITSTDLFFSLKIFNDWNKVLVTDLIVSEYSKTEKLKRLEEIYKSYKDILYTLREFLGSIATLNFIINSSCFSDREALEYLENNSPFLDRNSNEKCMEMAREF